MNSDMFSTEFLSGMDDYWTALKPIRSDMDQLEAEQQGKLARQQYDAQFDYQSNLLPLQTEQQMQTIQEQAKQQREQLELQNQFNRENQYRQQSFGLMNNFLFG